MWLYGSKDKGGFGFEEDSLFAAIVLSGDHHTLFHFIIHYPMTYVLWVGMIYM